MANTATFAQLPSLSSIEDSTIIPCWDTGQAQGVTIAQIKAYIAAYIAANINQSGNPTPTSQVVLFDGADNTPWNPYVYGGALKFVALNPASVSQPPTVYLLADAGDGTLWQISVKSEAVSLASVAIATSGTTLPNLVDVKDGTTWQPSVTNGKFTLTAI